MEKIKQHLALFLFFSFIIIACKQKQKEEPVEQKIKTPDSSLVTQQPEITANTYAGVDVSPMDMSYFPID